MSRTQITEPADDLTKIQRGFLRKLKVREFYGTDRPCWLADLPRNVYLLLVPVDFAPIDTNGTYRGRPTLSGLQSKGLIEYGPDQALPDDIASRAAAYRRRLGIKVIGRDWGSTVTLTAAGRELCATLDGPTKTAAQ